MYSGLPEGTKQLFGKKVDFAGFRGYMQHSQDQQLSGGQSQKIAVSRTLMRAQGGKDRIGLLLFDEPSASLDPEAEYSAHPVSPAPRGVTDARGCQSCLIRCASCAGASR